MADAYRHTLHMEGGQETSVLTFDEDPPFGVRGKDYDPSYTTTVTPLFEKLDPSDLHVAIGEDAFRAGWAACVKRIGEVGHLPVGSLEAAWSEYTPPEELCGHG